MNQTKQKISALDDADEQRMEQQRSVIRDIALEHLGNVEFDASDHDLKLLQKLIDARLFKPTNIFDQQCMGILYGDVIAKKAHLEWVIVEDEQGRSAALRLPKTKVVLFPLTMISKRLSRAEPMNLREHFDNIIRDLEKIKKNPDRAGKKVVAIRKGKSWWKFW